MKKRVLFIRWFLLLNLLGGMILAVVAIVGRMNLWHISIIGNLMLNAFLAYLSVSLFEDTQITLAKVDAMHILVEYTVSVKEEYGMITGVLPFWKGFFVGSLTFNETTMALNGPKYIIRRYRK